MPTEERLRHKWEAVTVVLALAVVRRVHRTDAAWAGDDQYTKLGRLNLNTDPRYSRWPNPSHIPYQISPDYAPEDENLIRDSMEQIFLDTLGCVRFAEYNAQDDAGQDFVVISPAIDGTCWSYPGLLPASGAGQKLGISLGKNGCLHNKRLVMKTLFHVLGKRSEHNRPDRDDYLEMHLENLDPAFVPFSPYQKYLDSTVYYQGFPYDYNSITHHLPTAYAVTGTTVFTVRDPTKTIGDKSRLSYWDCYAMAMQYQCQDILRNDLCRNLDGYKPSVTVLAGVPSRPSGTKVALAPVPPSAQTWTTSEATPVTTAETTAESTVTVPAPSTSTTSDSTILDEQFPFFPDPEGNMVANSYKANYATLVRKSGPLKRNICDPGFRVDAAVQSQDGRIIIFSGDDYYVITSAGYVKDGPLSVKRDFADISSLPITAAFTVNEKDYQKTTHIIAAQNDYYYVDLTFLDYVPIVEEDLLLPNLQTIFTLPGPVDSAATYEFRIYNGFGPNMQFIQAGSRGKKVPLVKSKIFIGNASMLPATIDALVSFELGSLGNTVDAALIFSGDLIYLMDVDYSCLSTLKFPCLNAQKRSRFPLPIRSVLNCNAYAIARSYSGAAARTI